MKSNKIWKQVVSEWKDLYLDYNELKIFVNSIHSIIDQNKQIAERWQIKQNNSIALNSYPFLVPEYNHNMVLIKNNLQQINSMFNYIYERKAFLSQQFCRYKYEEVEYRLMLSNQYAKIANQGEVIKNLIPYIQYNYIQAAYLTTFQEINLDFQAKIINKHFYYAHDVVKTHDKILANSFNPSLKVLDDVVERIQNLYIDKVYPLQGNKSKKPKEKRDYLRSLANKIQTPNYDIFSSGVFVGMFLAVVVFLSLLLIYKNKSAETDPIFKRDFPTWRGIAIIILYIWVIGLNVSLYRQYKVSHFLAFEFKQPKWLTSTKIFKLSGIFSTLYVILFSVYVLNLSTLINLNPFQPEYLVLIIWLALIFFMINPFPIMYFKTRSYIFKRLLKLPTSLCIGVTFVTSFIASQLMSLFVPFEDFMYTICYFTVLDFQIVDKVNICKRPAQICVFVFILFIFIYKLIQHIKEGLDKQLTLFSIQFLNILKYILVIIVAILSFIYAQGDELIYNIWVIIGIAAVLIFCITDMMYEWDLGQIDSNNCLLRNNLSYPKIFYYVLIGVNVVLRFIWIFTLSQNIISKYFDQIESNPQLFRLLVGSIEILRVSCWNMLTVQKPVLKNCQQFKAIPEIRNTIQKIIIQRVEEERENGEDQYKIVYNGRNFEKNMADIRQKVQELQKERKVISQHLEIKEKQTKSIQSTQTTIIY